MKGDKGMDGDKGPPGGFGDGPDGSNTKGPDPEAGAVGVIEGEAVPGPGNIIYDMRKGPVGPPGASGDVGSAGDSGDDGKAGKPGRDGPAGPRGFFGNPGQKGESGTDGTPVCINLFSSFIPIERNMNVPVSTFCVFRVPLESKDHRES